MTTLPRTDAQYTAARDYRHALEESKKKTFVNGITTRQILNNALTELFPYDPTLNTDISCTCNTD